jgi:hypothetical protein
MQALPVVHFRQSLPRRSRSGFALLITITLLAFLILLLVGLATLTRVETTVADNSQQQQQARQNALMALNVALGELQRAAGPDQRTTATASLGDGATGVPAANASANGLGAVGNGTRYWTGVWGNADTADSIFTRAPQPVLLNWLVSGNRTNFTATADGHISAPTLAAPSAFTPADAVTESDGSALSSATVTSHTLRIKSQPAALLLGSGTAGDNIAAYVAAPLVDIVSDQVNGLAGSHRVGRFAWWVGDEGVKAKFNLPDPYITNASPNSATSTGSRDSRYRLLAAQRNGIEQMSGFAGANYPLAVTDPASLVYQAQDRTLTASAIGMAAPSVASSDLKKHVHDLTTYSYGVLADSQFGGLRRDLTFHLDSQSGDTFLDGRNILPDGPTPVSSFPGSRYTAASSLFSETVVNGGLGYTALNLSPRLGPKWDQLKSFYRIGYDHPGDLEVQPSVDIDASQVTVQTAVTPVILEARTLFALKSGPTIDTSIIVILGNPYSRPLKASQGVNFRILLHQDRYTGTSSHATPEFGLTCNYVSAPVPAPQKITSVFTRRLAPTADKPSNVTAPPIQGNYNGGATDFHHYYPILKFAVPPAGDGPTDPDAGHPGVLDRVVFQIPPGVLNLAPGETKAYKINPSTSLPNESIEGESFKVIPLQEMTNSIPTYFSQVCDPYYVSDPVLFPAGLLTGASINADAFFRVGHVSSVDSSVDYRLTLPGKPRSVLQMLGPIRLYETVGNSGPLFTVNGPTTVLGSSRIPLTGTRNVRLFGTAGGSEQYAGETVLTTHAEGNLLGTFQSSHLFVPGVERRSLLRGTYSRHGYPNADTDFTNFLDPGSAAQAAWGEGWAGNPLRVSPAGRYVLSDLPAAVRSDEIPLLSLGQLQHADLTADDEALGVNMQPGQPMGNSRYNRFVDRATSRTGVLANGRSQRYSNQSDSSSGALGDSPQWYEGYVPALPKQTGVRRYDMSYLLNAALWDGTFLSTVRPTAGSDSTVAPQPANRRLVYLSGKAPTLGQLRGADASEALPDPGLLAAGENGRIPAAQLLNNGAFNVNSTSVEAWTAVLSGLRGLGVGTTTAVPNQTPFAHSIRQPGDAQSILPGATTVKKAENTYVGFRALTDAQVRALAVAVVDQVKARGPFLSLSQFVNRNLTAGAAPGNAVGDTSLSGAIQQAIDRTDINANLNKSSGLTRATAARESEYPDNGVMPEGDSSGLSPYMAAPGWLSQADVLQAIAPALASRSDTFIIRAYGELVDPVNSPAAPAEPQVKARAWCEAVVQRLPGYMDDSQRPSLRGASLNSENQTFGRRFRIVSFRWLSPNDI